MRISDWSSDVCSSDLHLAVDPASRSTTSVCLKFADHAVEGLDDEAQLALVKKMASLLEGEKAAYDVAGYRDAPPGIRIWCGATVDTSDIEALGPWLDWAWRQARTASSRYSADPRIAGGSQCNGSDVERTGSRSRAIGYALC